MTGRPDSNEQSLDIKDLKIMKLACSISLDAIAITLNVGAFRILISSSPWTYKFTFYIDSLRF